jgi:hypothetical protein
MPTGSYLSQEVQRFFTDQLDLDGVYSEETEANEALKIVEALVDDIVSSREMITDNKLAFFEKRLEDTPEIIEEFLDERFTRDVINAVPGYVRRTLELSRLEGSRLPSTRTNGYLREASRTYIFGLPQASIALCRAALEQALKENLGSQGTGTFVNFNALLDEAEGAQIIDNTIRKMARRIATEADKVLHERLADLPKAYEVLMILRGVLQHIYSE